MSIALDKLTFYLLNEKFRSPQFLSIFHNWHYQRKEKEHRPKKKDFSPSLINFGPIQFHLARHFGFCYGVENAIEISYKAIEENPGKNIYLLSQMIHNPIVNDDLLSKGLKFIMDTEGNQLIEWDKITSDDVVITPAFGTTVEIKKQLEEKNITLEKYDTTCPFVTRVWKKAHSIGENDFTIIIHGKHKHEETKATFSHSYQNAPSLIIKDIDEAKLLVDFIEGKKSEQDFYRFFEENTPKGLISKMTLREWVLSTKLLCWLAKHKKFLIS